MASERRCADKGFRWLQEAGPSLGFRGLALPSRGLFVHMLPWPGALSIRVLAHTGLSSLDES